MKMNVDMSKVAQCQVTECLYNRDRGCHARAITVGDEGHARCDTFATANQHTREKQLAGVGACKVSDCEYNTDFECQAAEITVDHCQDHADCVTYEKRA